MSLVVNPLHEMLSSYVIESFFVFIVDICMVWYLYYSL